MWEKIIEQASPKILEQGILVLFLGLICGALVWLLWTEIKGRNERDKETNKSLLQILEGVQLLIKLNDENIKQFIGMIERQLK